MILRKVVRESIANYFLESPHWLKASEMMSKDDIQHAHIYIDTVLHPSSIKMIVERYYRANKINLKRKIQILSQAKGVGNVYYIDPEGLCHYEIFCRYNRDVVIEPTPAGATRGGASFECWGKSFMAEYYKKFPFKKMGEMERLAVEKYFRSNAWKQSYLVMAYSSGRNFHSHCLITTSLHPEDILPIGVEAIKAKGWEVDRAVSLVFGMAGYDQGKITFLLKKPQIVLELEWEFDPEVVIEPGVVPISRIMTDEMIQRDLSGMDYLHLDESDLDWLEAKFASAR